MNFTIDNENEAAKVSLETTEKDGVCFIKVNMNLCKEESPKRLRVSWDFPAIKCYSLFGPSLRGMRSLEKNWQKQETASRFTSWMPLHAIVSAEGKNRLCIAVSDTLTPISLYSGVREENGNIECAVDFFTKLCSPIKEYTAIIRLDTRELPYYESVYDCVSWWEQECGCRPAYVPEAAKRPMYSTWYSFHQLLDKNKLLQQSRLSKEMGMDTILIDDGWQTDDCQRGYAYCGDWKPAEKKVGNIQELVDEVHKIGMKVMLWYSVPFVGLYSEAYSRFAGMFLYTNEYEHWSVLDPRFPQVRDYLVDIYKKAVKEWNLDGLKLDFIDSFELTESALIFDERRDFVSVEEAVECLLQTVTNELKRLKPDILIEFRQNYVGPSVRKYGNMLRVTDCPNDALRNRTDIINLRLTSGDTAVHSDMLMWNKDDAVEHAALQIASSIFSVPQISVMLDEISEEHRKMLKFYLAFWHEYRDVLMQGYFVAKNPESNYSQASSAYHGRKVYTVFTDTVVDDLSSENAIINASANGSIIVKNAMGKRYHTVDCMGYKQSSGIIENGVFEITVPLAGIVYIYELCV